MKSERNKSNKFEAAASFRGLSYKSFLIHHTDTKNIHINLTKYLKH